MLKTEPVWLSDDDAVVTASYLAGLSERSPDIAANVQTLFGRCCLSTLSDEIDLDALAGEAAVLGRRILDYPDPHQLALDPLLLMESHLIFERAGKRIAVLHELHDRMASELLQQPAEAQRIGRVRVIASRLASLGYRVQVAKPGKDAAALLKSPERWFGASVTQLADLADHLIADSRRLDSISTKILSLIALAELRNYRVDLGCTLLRAVFQLGEKCSEAMDALSFIALQRRRDGRYGFSNQFAESAERDGDQHMSLYLPLTVNAVWLFRTEAGRDARIEAAASA
jgi:hypothetical protein